MNHLLVCTGCQRHVRAREALCPFCGEMLPMSLRRRRPILPKTRLGRAATLAFGAALATTGCGDDMGETDAGDGTMDAGDGTMDAGDGTADAGDGTMDAGDGTMDAGDGTTDAGDGTTDGGATDAGDIDAGPGRTDAGNNGRDAGGGIMPLYGGPMLPDGGLMRRDAGGDAGGGITPLYGAPPRPGS